MLSALISRSPDLLRLQNEGHELEVRGGYLLVANVPYVDSQRIVRRGMLVTELTLAGGVTAKPSTHVALFVGDQPCNKDGVAITGLQHGAARQDLGDGLIVDRSFSNKPPDGYPDYYAKMKRYVTMISDPARALDPSVTAQTHRPIPATKDESPFVYRDTNSSRAYIAAISAKLEGQRLAIVGLGGTGSYLLDLAVKTPVSEIHLFDGDRFFDHNAFRSPGAAALDVLARSPLKVDYLKDTYSQMHRGIVTHPEFISVNNVSLLDGFSYVFLCMDASEDKRVIIDYLVERGIPLIDAGLGVQATEGKLLGMVRTTAVTPQKNDHRQVRISCIETPQDDYASNIQIAELNALNATLAVIKWKKLAGVYVDYEHEHNSTYTLSGNMLLSEDIHA